MKICMYAFFSDILRREGACEAVRFVKNCGFDAFEVLQALRPGARPLFESADKARELRALMDKEGLRCACYSISANVLADNLGESFDQSGVDALKHCADMAKILGSPFLHHTLTIGYVPSDPAADSLDAILDDLLDRASEVAEYANSLGLTVLYEPQGFYVNGLDGFTRFYEGMKQRGYKIGVCGDVGNSLYVNCAPDAFFAKYASEVLHVHLKDLHVEDEVLSRQNAAPSRSWNAIRDGRMITETRLGEGMVDMDACMAHLRRVRYNGYYALETCYWNNLSVSLAENLARDCAYMLENYPEN